MATVVALVSGGLKSAVAAARYSSDNEIILLHVDLDDFNIFAGCLEGPDVLVEPDCELAGLDRDGDVDLADFAELQAAFSG